MPSRAWVVTWNRSNYKERNFVSMPSRAWVVTKTKANIKWGQHVSMPSRAWVVTRGSLCWLCGIVVSMPSRAWVVTADMTALEARVKFQCPHGLELLHTLDETVVANMAFQCPHGLELLLIPAISRFHICRVSMPSRAWVVTARMSNILNFLWYFLCIPAIYKCILAYLPIFFNQLSEFLRCESPSAFLGTCLSHHSFIILLITSTSALLTGLYLISTSLP